MLGVETRVQDVADTLGKRVDDISASVTELGDEAGATAASMAALASSVDNAKAQFITDLGAELDTRKLALASVVNEARTEFYTLRSELQTLYSSTAAAFADVKAKVEQMEQDNAEARGGGGGSKSGVGMASLLPMKSLV